VFPPVYSDPCIFIWFLGNVEKHSDSNGSMSKSAGPYSRDSVVWDYFVRLPSGLTYCTLCGKKSSKHIHGIWYHLKRHHPNEAKIATKISKQRKLLSKRKSELT